MPGAAIQFFYHLDYAVGAPVEAGGTADEVGGAPVVVDGGMAPVEAGAPVEEVGGVPVEEDGAPVELVGAPVEFGELPVELGGPPVVEPGADDVEEEEEIVVLSSVCMLLSELSVLTVFSAFSVEVSVLTTEDTELELSSELLPLSEFSTKNPPAASAIRAAAIPMIRGAFDLPRGDVEELFL